MSRFLRAVAILAGGLALSAPAVVFAHASVAPALMPALRLPAGTAPADIDLGKPLDDPLPVHLRGDPDGRTAEIRSCADYEKLRARVNGSDNEPDYAVVKLEGARCDALAVLKQAVRATGSALPAGDFLSWRDARQYPGALWAAFSPDETARLAAPGATLRTASGKAALEAVSGRFLQLENRAAGVHLTLLGLADVDHDGWQDAVVLVEGYAKGGSNTTARIAVLTRRGGDAALREVPLGGVLH